MSPRLSAVVSFIPKGARVADVGTDHGFLPIYLAKRDLASYILASDVNKAPLFSAIKNAEACGVRDNIVFKHTNGLFGAKNENLNAVVFAGMGGETIVSALSAAPWAMKQGMTFIFQPQSKLEVLSDFLTSNEIYTEDARLALDAGRIYLIFKASIRTGSAPSEAEIYAPRALFFNRDMLLPDYLEELIKKLTRAIDGMEKAKLKPLNQRFKKALEGLQKMKEECHKWQR